MSFSAAQPLLKLLVYYLVCTCHERCHPATEALEVGSRYSRKEVGDVGCCGLFYDILESTNRRSGLEVDREQRAREHVHGRRDDQITDGDGHGRRYLIWDVARQFLHLVLAQRMQRVQPARRQQLGRAELPQGAPPGVRWAADDRVGEVPVGEPDVDGRAACQIGVVHACGVRGGDDDGVHDAEPHGHERAKERLGPPLPMWRRLPMTGSGKGPGGRRRRASMISCKAYTETRMTRKDTPTASRKGAAICVGVQLHYQLVD
jgi:hypothetical protein